MPFPVCLAGAVHAQMRPLPAELNKRIPLFSCAWVRSLNGFPMFKRLHIESISHVLMSTCICSSNILAAWAGVDPAIALRWAHQHGRGTMFPSNLPDKLKFAPFPTCPFESVAIYHSAVRSEQVQACQASKRETHL